MKNKKTHLSSTDTPVELFARSSISTLVSARTATSSTARESAAAAAGSLSPERTRCESSEKYQITYAAAVRLPEYINRQSGAFSQMLCRAKLQTSGSVALA